MSNTHNFTILAQTEPLIQPIGEYVPANDKSRLRAFFKQYHLNLRDIYNGLVCKRNYLLLFVAKYKN